MFTGLLGGFRIVESDAMVDVVPDVWDWSRVRSRSRAERRMAPISKRGRPKREHRQNVRPVFRPKQEILRIGDQMFCHPVVARQLREAVRA